MQCDDSCLVIFSPWLRICSWLELRGKRMVSYVPQVREEQMITICLCIHVCVAQPMIVDVWLMAVIIILMKLPYHYCHRPHMCTHSHGRSHTHMHIQTNPYHLFLPHLRNITYHPFTPQLQPAADPQPRTEVD